MKLIVNRATHIVDFYLEDDTPLTVTSTDVIIDGRRATGYGSSTHSVLRTDTRVNDFEPNKYKFINSWKTLDDKDPVPAQVTRMQAKTVLHMAGLLTSIQTFMDDPGTDPIYKIAWDEAQTFDRNSQTIAALQSTLGLTDDQIDDLFRQASTITA